MKKYILMLVIFAAAWTSCTNDDITISYATNFKINPSTVIAPFTFEMTPGELESFDSDYKLRIRLLIYNTEGILVKEDVQYFTNYATIMSSPQNLAYGEYIGITISDVVKYEGNQPTFEFWKLSEHNKLADTKIEDLGYIGFQYKILGISKTNFTVNDESSRDVNINVQPAGSLMFVYYQNIRSYSDVVTYGLTMSKTGEECTFDSQGSYTVSAKNNNGSFDWWLDNMDVDDFETSVQNVYSYVYALPLSNLNLKFQAVTDSGDLYDLGSTMTINSKAGEEYLFSIDLSAASTGYDVEYGIVNRTRSDHSFGNMEGISLMKGVANKNVLHLKDIN